MARKKNKNLGGVLSGISPLLGLIPGAGAVAGPAAGILETLIQSSKHPQQEMAPNQQNTNPYGMAEGGYMPQGAYAKTLTDKKERDKGAGKFLNTLIPILFGGAFAATGIAAASNRGKSAETGSVSTNSLSTKSVDANALYAKASPNNTTANWGAPFNPINYVNAASSTPFNITEFNNTIDYTSPERNSKGLIGLPDEQLQHGYNTTLYAANGGYLNSVGPNTQQVHGYNPSQKDGVELPNAFVDHGETISNTSVGEYVFSDRLKNPLTGNTFAKDDKKLAQSDKSAAAKHYDKEAENTLALNNKLRETFMKLNDLGRAIVEAPSKNVPNQNMALGGKLMLANGGPPWENFDFESFYGFINDNNLQPEGFMQDSTWGKGHQALWDKVGDSYSSHIGASFDPKTKSYTFGIPETNFGKGMSVADYTTGKTYNVEPKTTMHFDPKTLVTSRNTTDEATYAGMMPNYSELGKQPTAEEMAILAQHSLPGYPLSVSPLAPAQEKKEEPILGPLNTDVSTRTGELKPGPIKDEGEKSRVSKLGTALQVGELLAKGATLLRGIDKQKLYTNNAPINAQQYDPSAAQMANQYDFNALRSAIGNTVGDNMRQAQQQQAFANKYKANAQIASQYDQMNKQAATQYEERLAQRQAQNNQARYLTDDINARNEGAFFNALRGMFTDVGNMGRAKVDQQSNQQAVKWLLEAFPDLVNTNLAKSVRGEKTKKTTKDN